MLVWHNGGHSRGAEGAYDDLVFGRLNKLRGDPTRMKQELQEIGRELERIDRAGPKPGWTPLNKETTFNTVNQWVKEQKGIK